jgi:polysaccharide biosynthesis PFTS motif protein
MSKFTKDFFQILYLIILDKKLLIGSSSYLEGKCLQTLIDKFRLDLFLVCTQSQLVNQPSIFYFAKFHKFRTSMLWYSDNSLPLVSKSDYKIYRYDLSYLECRNIEMHYVMSKQFKKILSYYNQKKNIKVIQPFSFFYKYPLEISSSLVSNDKSFKIAYFPVTPMRNTPSDNFYSSTNLEKDLQRLIEVVDTFKGNKIEIELILKPKRQFTKTHSLKYAKLISEFQNMGLLTSISASSDPVRICKGMDLVICTPYTSVALLSKYLKVRSVYFIDRGSLTFFNPEPTIPLINGKIDLQRYINKCLKK